MRAALAVAVLVVTLAPHAAGRTVPGPRFHLALAGVVPADEEFVLYVQTDPPMLEQTRVNFCEAANEATSPDVSFAVCASGEQYGLFPATFEAGTVIEFRYERWVGGRAVTFYEGRVTVTEENPNPTFTVTYDYSLRLPDTAMSGRPSTAPIAVALLLTLLSVLVLGRRHRA